MQLTLRLDPGRLRRWHVQLVERLAARPATQVRVEWASSEIKIPSAVAHLLALERLVYGVPAGDPTTQASKNDLAAYTAAPASSADLVLDFCGSPVRDTRRVWRVTFDGVSDEAAALAALLEWRTPIVSIIDIATRATVITGHPGTEVSGAFVIALQDVLARTATLIAAALDGAAARDVIDVPQPAVISFPAVAHFALRSFAAAALGRLYRLCCHAPHWRVGYRFLDRTDVFDLGIHPAQGWRELPDDRRRFYADPFPLAKSGAVYVFVEEFQHSTGRGLISAVAFDEKGPVGKPSPVLEEAHHLSYPFVFEHRGDVWMVPESSAAGTIDLYRSEYFPGRWVKVATLVSGLVASDATLFEHNGRWWMLATVRDGGGAFSDALHAWSADDIHGPWVSHPRNPVLVDIAAARPAGRVVRRNGRLLRPFQDCRRGYGSALGVAEITRLDDEGFAQRVEAILRPGPRWPGRRLHTLNRAGRLECIDGSATAWRF